jgi:hypothetical protein
MNPVKLPLLLLLAASVLLAEICPYCVREKAKSRVVPGLCTRTALGYQPYYDEAGVLHDEDPNYSVCDFECSRGHLYKRRIGPGKFVGPAEPQGDVQVLQTTMGLTSRLVLPHRHPPDKPISPKRVLTCTINAEEFQALKEGFVGCQRGNCTSSPMPDAAVMLRQFFDTVECR